VGVQPAAAAPADGVPLTDPTVQRTLAYEPALDGLRGVSIAAVTLFHACATSSLAGWFRGGALGVSVFFTLSGFLITTVLLREAAVRRRVDLRRFWGRRIRRLAPASLAVVVAVVLLGRTALFDVGAREAAATVWSSTNWNVVAEGQRGLLRTIVGPLGPTWSLAVEEQFYVALAVVVAVCVRRSRPQRALAVVFAGVVCVSIGLANVVSDWHPRLEFGTDVRAAELAAGGLLALAVSRWGERIRRGRMVDAIGLVALLGLAVLFLTADYTPPWLLRGGFAAVAVVSAAAIGGALAGGRTAALLATVPLVAVGRWSYSLYLVHWPVFLALTEARVGIDGWGLVVVKCAAATAIAFALHVVVEQPLRHARNQRLGPTVVAWLAASAAVTALAVALG
jgi:peptidoglycan/LPS O-acetylase OafA/YrhL